MLLWSRRDSNPYRWFGKNSILPVGRKPHTPKGEVILSKRSLNISKRNLATQYYKTKTATEVAVFVPNQISSHGSQDADFIYYFNPP